MYKIYFLTGLFFCFEFCNSQNSNIIVPLKMLTEIYSVKPDSNIVTYRTDFFMIENYYSSGVDRVISDYAKKNLDSSYLKKYGQYTMLFYKKSDRVNIENINRYSQDGKWKAIQDDDPIIEYTWRNGNLNIYTH